MTKVFPERPKAGENRIRFEPVVATRFRLQFPSRGRAFLHGSLWPAADLREAGTAGAAGRARCSSPATSSSRSDILVSVIRVHNPTDQVQTIYVDPTIRPGNSARLLGSAASRG